MSLSFTTLSFYIRLPVALDSTPWSKDTDWELEIVPLYYKKYPTALLPQYVTPSPGQEWSCSNPGGKEEIANKKLRGLSIHYALLLFPWLNMWSLGTEFLYCGGGPLEILWHSTKGRGKLGKSWYVNWLISLAYLFYSINCTYTYFLGLALSWLPVSLAFLGPWLISYIGRRPAFVQGEAYRINKRGHFIKGLPDPPYQMSHFQVFGTVRPRSPMEGLLR